MKNDEINNPSHYTDGRAFQPKDVIRDLHLNFNLGNVVKYISRAGRKPGESKYKDLNKAKTYLGFEIEYLRNNPQFPFVLTREYKYYFDAIAKDWNLTEEEAAIIKCVVVYRFNWPKLETAYKQLEDLINNCKKDHALEMFEESKKADSINGVWLHFFDSESEEIGKAREYYKFIQNESNCIKDALNNIDVNCSDIKERDFDKEFVSIEKAQNHIKNIIKVYEKKGNKDKEDEIKNLKEALNHLDNMKEINRAIAKLERLDNDETETI